MTKILQNIKTDGKKRDSFIDSVISRTGPITDDILEQLIGKEYKILSKNILKTKLKKWEDDRFNIDFSNLDFYSFKSFPRLKVLHNLLLLYTYLLIKNKIGANLHNTFFDGEINIPIFESFLESGTYFLQPDIIIIKDGTLYCIELDMGTEGYGVLHEKYLSYKKFKDKYPDLFKIKIIFSSFEKRNEKIKEYKIFKDIDIMYINLDKYLLGKFKKIKKIKK